MKRAEFFKSLGALPGAMVLPGLLSPNHGSAIEEWLDGLPPTVDGARLIGKKVYANVGGFPDMGLDPFRADTEADAVEAYDALADLYLFPRYANRAKNLTVCADFRKTAQDRKELARKLTCEGRLRPGEWDVPARVVRFRPRLAPGRYWPGRDKKVFLTAYTNFAEEVRISGPGVEEVRAYPSTMCEQTVTVRADELRKGEWYIAVARSRHGEHQRRIDYKEEEG